MNDTDITPTPTGIDPLQLAVLASRFDSIVRAMTNTLLRTARSAILNTARDFSCCVLTADDEILTIADSLPIHVMSGPDLISKYMKACHPTLRRGDAFSQSSVPRELASSRLVRCGAGDRR